MSGSNAGCGQQPGCGQGGCGGGGGEAPPAAAASVQTGAAPPAGTQCMKCRKQDAQVVARGREPLCHPCLYEQLLAKVRSSVRCHSLIQPGDRLALALSGGHASALLLRFLASELRSARTDRPERGKVSFSLHILHIDESAALGLAPEEAAARRASLAAAAAPYCSEAAGPDGGTEGGTVVRYHCVPLEAVFEEEAEEGEAGSSVAVEAGPDSAAVGSSTGTSSSNGGSSRNGSAPSGLLAALAGAPPSERQRQRLAALLSAVADPTGRQDLIRHLRTRLLLRCAAVLGCGRVARGDCATSLATHIVAAASKGCGYSLPGDVQLFDARYGARLPSFFLPLREVSSRELRTVCSHWQLPLAEGDEGAGDGGRQGPADKKNINALAAAFVAGMEAHKPGSVPNILNTISKLQAFSWNEPPQQEQASARQRRRQPDQPQAGDAAANGAAGGDRGEEERPQQRAAAAAGAVLCPICLAALADDELPGAAGPSSGGSGSNPSSEHTSGGTGAVAAAARMGCCLSCYAQVLGGVSGPAPGSQQAAVDGSGNGSKSSGAVAALPAEVRRQMEALAEAGRRAAAPEAAAGEAGEAADAVGGSSNGDVGSADVERLRAQIAEFLLD